LEWLLASLFVDSLQPDNGAVARCIVPDRKYARKKFLQRRNTLEPLCEDKKRAQVSTLLTDLGLLHYGYAVCDHSSVFLELVSTPILLTIFLACTLIKETQNEDQ
jgi:hypothetical protein